MATSETTMKHEMTGWQQHQLDHMQFICTLLQADNHASTSSLRPDALPDAEPTVSKHWRQEKDEIGKTEQ